jgi:hypothetical protein
MPKKAKKKTGPAAAQPQLGVSPGLPQPQHVPQDRVGEVVQDFISFGRANSVEAHRESEDMWLVTVRS